MAWMHSAEIFANSSVVYEEALLTIALVLDHGWPAGPVFLHALNTIIEAVVLNEHVYFDPRHRVGESSHTGTIEQYIENSEFLQLLIQEKALEPFPGKEVIEERLAVAGNGYSFMDFVSDATWTGDSFAYGSPTDEANRLKIYLELGAGGQELLQSDDLAITHAGLVYDFDPKKIKLSRLAHDLRFNDQDVRVLEGLNRRARSYLKLSNACGLHLCPYYLALPHQFGSIRNHNSTTSKLYQKIIAELSSKDSGGGPEFEVGQDQFKRVSIPAVSELLLSRCTDSLGALGLELLELRNTHRDFRAYLTQYQVAWDSAKTKQARWKMQNEFNSALKKIIEREDKPSTRFIYWIWDVVKEPTKILTAIGDKLVEAGRNEYVIGHARGMHDFWQDMKSGPPSDVARDQFRRLFSNQAQEECWALSLELAEQMERSLGTRPDPREP